MQNLKDILLPTAEIFDAWRVIPRIVLVLYASLVFSLYLWYRSIPTYVQEQCDESLIGTLLAQGVDLAEAQAVACTVIDIVGGPTMAQSTFVTTIIGLSTGIFGLYVATGRKWDKIGYYERFPHPSYPPQEDDRWHRRRPWGPRQPHYGPYRNEQPQGPEQPPVAPKDPEFSPSENGPKWDNPFGDDKPTSAPRNPNQDVR